MEIFTQLCITNFYLFFNFFKGQFGDMESTQIDGYPSSVFHHPFQRDCEYITTAIVIRLLCLGTHGRLKHYDSWYIELYNESSRWGDPESGKKKFQIHHSESNNEISVFIFKLIFNNLYTFSTWFLYRLLKFKAKNNQHWNKRKTFLSQVL